MARNILDEVNGIEQTDLNLDAEAYEKAVDDINSLTENNGVTVSGRIFRLTGPADQVAGRQACELVGKVDEFIDEDYVGRHYGSGRYKVRFRVYKNGETKGTERIVIFNIGKEYDKYVQDQPKSASIEPPRVETVTNYRDGVSSGAAAVSPFSGLSALLTPANITAVVAAIEGIKRIFTPAPVQQPDWIRLIEVISKRDEPKPSFSDSIVLSAMESLKEKNKTPSVFEQIRDVERLKDVLLKDNNADDEKEKDSGEMNLLLKAAFEYLPKLLAANNNNYRAVGQQAAEMPYIKNLVSNDPELAQQFFSAARDKYGFDAAQKLAQGFGYNMQIAPETDAIDGQDEQTTEGGEDVPAKD